MSMTDSLASQDGRKTLGKTPVYRPSVNGEELDITVSSLKLMMGDSQHDQATLSATSDALLETTSLAGKAISFFYGLTPRTELFNGYIEAVKDDATESTGGHLSFTLSCIGTTKSLQEGAPRFFTNNTIPEAVENLSYRGLLGFHGHGHSLSWPVLAQTEESDWRFVSNLATRLGWSLFNRYGVVMLYNPSTLLTENGSFITLISKQYTSTSYEDYERALIDFTPTEESDTSYRQIGRKIAYFNNGVVQSVTQSGDKYTIFKYLTGVVARNPQEAGLYANNTSYMASNWSQQAMARVLGNANIFPGMSVEILTTNPKFYTGRYNGRWLVRAVNHSADRQTFQTELALCRPNNAQVANTAYVPFWNQISGFIPVSSGPQVSNTPPSMNLPPLKPRPSMLLHDGRWQSSWTNLNVRSAA